MAAGEAEAVMKVEAEGKEQQVEQERWRPVGAAGWERGERGGWLRRRLGSSAFIPDLRHIRLTAMVFQLLTGRLPAEQATDLLVAADAARGKTYAMDVKHTLTCNISRTNLQGSAFRAWLADSGAQQGDSIAFKRQGDRLLVRRIPAPPQAKGRRSSRGAPALLDQGGQQQQQPVASPTQQPQEAEGSDATKLLGFAPRSTPSIAAALEAELPAELALRGVSEKDGAWVVQFSRSMTPGRVEFQQRRHAAVAADVVMSWRRHYGYKAAAALVPNVPAAGYAEDEELAEQLRQLHTAPQLELFLHEVLGDEGTDSGAEDDDEEEEEAGEGEALQLQFEPHLTPSLVAALISRLGASARIQGATRNPTGALWTTHASWKGQTARVYRLDQQQAAVAADIVLLWHRSFGDRAYAATYNWRTFNVLPQSQYMEDAELLAQLKQLKSAAQMKLFLEEIVVVQGVQTVQRQQQQTQQQQRQQQQTQQQQQQQQRADVLPSSSCKRKHDAEKAPRQLSAGGQPPSQQQQGKQQQQVSCGFAGRRFYRGPRLVQTGPTLVVMSVPRSTSDSGSAAQAQQQQQQHWLYVPRAQLVACYASEGLHHSGLKARVERHAQEGDPPACLMASPEEVRLLVAHGCMQLHSSHATWVLLPALNRTLRGSRHLQGMVQALQELEAGGTAGLPEHGTGQAKQPEPAARMGGTMEDDSAHAAAEPGGQAGTAAAAAAAAAGPGGPATTATQGHEPAAKRRRLHGAPSAQVAAVAVPAPLGSTPSVDRQQEGSAALGRQQEQGRTAGDSREELLLLLPVQAAPTERDSQAGQLRQEQAPQRAQQAQQRAPPMAAQGPGAAPARNQQAPQPASAAAAAGACGHRVGQGAAGQSMQQQQQQQQQPPCQQLVQLAAREQQASEQRAAEAFERADRGSAESMRQALLHLALADHGGDMLQDLVGRWTELPLEAQQAAFGAALVVASRRAWQHLEARLRLALASVGLE